MPYRVVIMLLGSIYEKYVNAVKYEELKGNIEVLAVGDIAPYSRTLDGWRLCTTDEALACDFDYILFSQGIRETEEAARTFAKIGINEERVLSLEVFGAVCFDFRDYIKLHHTKQSIISINCWGGFTSHALRMKFRSPFVNLFMNDSDYLKLLQDLRGYMDKALVEDTDSEEAKKKPYPMAFLGDIQLHLNHYKTFAEAKELWDKRKTRINWDNLFVMMYTVHEENARLFDELPYEHKVIFTPFDFGVSCQICLEDYNAWIDNMEKDFWKSVNGVANGKLQYYNPIKLLNGDEDFYRIVK